LLSDANGLLNYNFNLQCFGKDIEDGWDLNLENSKYSILLNRLGIWGTTESTRGIECVDINNSFDIAFYGWIAWRFYLGFILVCTQV
jgi:hypothetical protein